MRMTILFYFISFIETQLLIVKLGNAGVEEWLVKAVMVMYEGAQTVVIIIIIINDIYIAQIRKFSKCAISS